MDRQIFFNGPQWTAKFFSMARNGPHHVCGKMNCLLFRLVKRGLLLAHAQAFFYHRGVGSEGVVEGGAVCSLSHMPKAL